MMEYEVGSDVPAFFIYEPPNSAEQMKPISLFFDSTLGRI
jgi:hypothetical protein